MGMFDFFKKSRSSSAPAPGPGNSVEMKPFTDQEKKAARARFEKLDSLADKALRPSLGSFSTKSPRALRQLERKLARIDLRGLLAIRETAETNFRSQATWQLVQQRINARIDAIDDPEELRQLSRFCDRLLNSHVTQQRARARLSRMS